MAIETTSQRVRQAMKAARRSQQEVAEHLNLSQAAVSRRMIGDVDWKAGELTALAAFLEVDPRDLLAPADTVDAA